MSHSNNRTLLSEFIASFLLLFTVVGVGMRIATLFTDPALQLMSAVISIMFIGSIIWQVANRIAPTHMNPLITIGLMARRKIEVAFGTEHLAAQVSGALIGVVIGNTVFGLEAFSPADQGATSANRYVGEFVVSLGVVAITLLLHENSRLYMVGAAIPLWLVFGSALTASPSFGNPAISVANSISHTITSDPTSALPGLLSSQLLGGLAAYGLVWLLRYRHED